MYVYFSASNEHHKVHWGVLDIKILPLLQIHKGLRWDWILINRVHDLQSLSVNMTNSHFCLVNVCFSLVLGNTQSKVFPIFITHHTQFSSILSKFIFPFLKLMESCLVQKWITLDEQNPFTKVANSHTNKWQKQQFA